MSYRDAKGELAGVSVDLVLELQRRLGEREPIKTLPWPRAYRIATSHADKLLFTTTRNAEREPLFHWLLMINRNAWTFYARRDDQIVLDTLVQARKVERIGVLRGGAHETYLRAEGFTNLEPLDSYTQLLQNLAKGRVRLAFYSTSGFVESSRKAGLNTDNFSSRLMLKTPEAYIVLSKPGTTAETLSRWRSATDSLRADGTFEKIARQWIGKLYTEQGFEAHFANGAINLWPAPVE
ncbi:MAG: ABC transporter substrate-binding protein [Motiliproteus sp.]